MPLSNTSIVGFAEAKNALRSGRSTWEFAAEILESLLEQTGLERGEVDGLVLACAGAGSTFWVQSMSEYLGLETNFADLTDLGGCSSMGGVARAAAAIEAGICETVVLINADAVTTDGQSGFRSFYDEWGDPVSGLRGPPGAFGMLSKRYEHQYGLDLEVLGKLAVTQRDHALLNPNGVETFRKPITVEDYLASRIISDPIRLLDCVMPCDGANGLVMMSRKRAREKGYARFVTPLGYAERTNFEIANPTTDITRTGHSVAGPRAFEMAGLKPSDIGSFHPYDDFLIAILMQLEMLGFCAPGQGCDFVRERSMRFDGDLPLNTSGGQISAGQAGLAGGGTNLVEAVRQLFGAAGERQVANTANALVTGIGWIGYGRNWGTSSVLILAPDA